MQGCGFDLQLHTKTMEDCFRYNMWRKKSLSNTNVLQLSGCHLDEGSSDNHREEEVPQEEVGGMSWGSEVEVLGKKDLERR